MSSQHAMQSRDSFNADPIWLAVDKYTKSHLDNSPKLNMVALDATISHSKAGGLPNIATYSTFSKMLAMQCKAGNVQHALEVGTLGGYTSIWIATMNPGIKVNSLEVDAKHAKVAQENIDRAGVADRVTITLAPALETLQTFLKEIKDDKRQPFGFTYIDADKANNWNYFDLAVQCSRPGATIYVDNIVRRGALAADIELDEEEDDDIIGARQLVESVGRDKRVEGVVIQTVAEKNYDGYLMAIVL